MNKTIKYTLLLSIICTTTSYNINGLTPQEASAFVCSLAIIVGAHLDQSIFLDHNQTNLENAWQKEFPFYPTTNFGLDSNDLFDCQKRSSDQLKLMKNTHIIYGYFARLQTRAKEDAEESSFWARFYKDNECPVLKKSSCVYIDSCCLPERKKFFASRVCVTPLGTAEQQAIALSFDQRSNTWETYFSDKR